MPLWIFPTDASLRYEFFALFQTVLQAFLYLREVAVQAFSGILKTLLKKTA